MAAFSSQSDGFYEDPSGRSPRSMRNPQVSRHNSRPMDGYASMQNSMFGNGNNPPALRFNDMRENNYGSMQGGPVHNSHFPYDIGAAQTWNTGSMQYNNGIGNMPQENGYVPSRSVKPSRGRAGLSNLWYEQGPQQQMQPPPLPMSGSRQASIPGRQDHHDDDELIPTAIVIKNIPFAVKKEQLVQLMVEMNLPLPYAFNYHFDNGVFRGLAFANFTSPLETEQVISALNHLELSGRKLRVEYKKMLPLAERERIEREKRERRGQLEEQHRPLGHAQSQLHNQVSMSSLSRNTPSPLSHRSNAARSGTSQQVFAHGPQNGQNGQNGQSSQNAQNTQNNKGGAECDMNDPQVLDFYTQLAMFKGSAEPETLIFSQDLEPHHRRVIHTLAHHMGLLHTSHGVAEQRQVHVQRAPPGSNISPPNPAMASVFGGPNKDNSRQNLVPRTSTSDFHDGRHYEGPAFSTLRGQSSVGLLDVVDNTGFGNAANSNLRNAKSFADLRSWSPSPAPSAASFPPAPQNNGLRLPAMNETAASATPTLTPTASNPSMGLGRDRDEPSFLISGMNSMGLGNGNNTQTSPRRQRSFFTPNSVWDEYAQTAPIGSKRTVSIGGENPSSDRMPVRQSRGPSSNNALGFRRQNGRGSDEMRHAASAIAE